MVAFIVVALLALVSAYYVYDQGFGQWKRNARFPNRPDETRTDLANFATPEPKPDEPRRPKPYR